MPRKKSKASRNKKSFTLLEMMIALMILGVLSALTAVHIKKMSDVHRFEGEVTDLFIALQEAQVLSAVYQTDLALDIFLEKGKWNYRFSTDEPFPEAKLKQKAVVLAHTDHIKFGKAKSLHFDIYSGGRIEPRGNLAFYQSKEKGKTLWFDLQRGHLLKFSYRKPLLVKQQIPKRV